MGSLTSLKSLARVGLIIAHDHTILTKLFSEPGN